MSILIFMCTQTSISIACTHIFGEHMCAKPQYMVRVCSQPLVQKTVVLVSCFRALCAAMFALSISVRTNIYNSQLCRLCKHASFKKSSLGNAGLVPGAFMVYYRLHSERIWTQNNSLIYELHRSCHYLPRSSGAKLYLSVYLSLST